MGYSSGRPGLTLLLLFLSAVVALCAAEEQLARQALPADDGLAVAARASDASAFLSAVPAATERAEAYAAQAPTAEPSGSEENTVSTTTRHQSCKTEVTILLAEVARLKEELKNAKEHLDKAGSPIFYRHALCAFGCVVLAALAAGLTMGLVSIEPMEMKIIVNTEDKDLVDEKDKLKLREDQAAARRVLPLIQDHHRLLVTLLLMNSIANEALPLFLDNIVPSWLAVILSVTLVLMFGEIIPSAIFTGSEQLRIAAKFAPMVAFFQAVLVPIAWPIAKILDIFLGEDHKGRYNFAELRAIVGIHARLNHDGESPHVVFKHHDDKGLGIITTERPHHFTDDTAVVFVDAGDHKPAKSSKLLKNELYYVKPCDPLVGRDQACTLKLYRSESRVERDLITFKEGELTAGAFLIQERDEIKIMHGVMNLTHMRAADAVTPLSEVNMLEGTDVLTKDKLQEVLQLGHSRLPVYHGNRHNIRGFILARRMIVVVPDDNLKVEDMDVQQLVLVPPDIGMLDLLNKFQADRTHMALITNAPDAVSKAWNENSIIPPDVHMMGIITLEDIIEKLIQEEIFDEYDTGLVNNSFSRTGSQDHLDSVKRRSRSSSEQISRATSRPLIASAASSSNLRPANRSPRQTHDRDQRLLRFSSTGFKINASTSKLDKIDKNDSTPGVSKLPELQEPLLEVSP